MNALNLLRDPTPSAMQSIRFAAEAVMRVDAAPWLANYFSNHSKRIALDFQWASDNFAPRSRVLEIGAYPFFLTGALRNLDLVVEAADKLSDPARRLASELDVLVSGCNIETEPLPFPESSFDNILFNEVFEHLRFDPIFTLGEIRRVLKPDGRLWLSTPNLRSLRGIMNFILNGEAWSVSGGGIYTQYEQLRTEGWMGHVRDYTSNEVGAFLVRSGFQSLQVNYRGEYGAPMARSITAALPSLRPYFSIIARKQ